MNAFFQHHKDNISFHYRCFDRILLNASIQPFQQPERVVGFFSTYRNVYPVTRNFLRDIANQYQNWVTNRSLAWDAPILDDPGDRRDEFMERYFRRARPDKLTVIYGRKYHSGKLQTTIEDLHLGNPVIRSYHQDGSVKQYVRDNLLLRTEATSNDIRWHKIGKAVENLPKVRKTLRRINENYLDIQQDILETFVDRGQLRRLCEPSLTSSGKRVPGLKLDHERQLALMQALVCFSHIAAGGTFTTREIHPKAAEALNLSPDDYKLGSLRYELSELRAKGLVEKIPHSRRYRVLPAGYRLCVVYLKLFKKIYAPLTAAILAPFPPDMTLAARRLRAPARQLHTPERHRRATATCRDGRPRARPADRDQARARPFLRGVPFARRIRAAHRSNLRQARGTGVSSENDWAGFRF